MRALFNNISACWSGEICAAAGETATSQAKSAVAIGMVRIRRGIGNVIGVFFSGVRGLVLQENTSSIATGPLFQFPSKRHGFGTVFWPVVSLPLWYPHPT